MTKSHWSDCAIYNEPAYPTGPCNCGGLDLAEDASHSVVVPLAPLANSLEDLIGKGEGSDKIVWER